MIGGERTEGRGASALNARVGALLARQHGLLARLEELSRRQMGLIEADEIGQLLELLRERQNVIGALQEAGEELEPLRPAWSAALELLPRAEREGAKERLAAISRLLEEVALRDGEASMRLKARREAVARELLAMERGRGALAAYGVRATGPRFSDREA
jgi:hypothetical protein